MKFGKMLSYISPALGMATGNGAGFLPYLSPGLGMLMGKGPFGGHHGGGHDDPNNAGQIPQGAGPGKVMPQAMPGQMGDVNSPMRPIQDGAPMPPTGFGQQAGMFGGQQGSPQEMLMRYRQMMMNRGGY